MCEWKPSHAIPNIIACSYPHPSSLRLPRPPQVNIFYTAPTAIRALHAKGDSFVKKFSRKSLRLLGSVGEPINPEAWRWYYDTVGDSRWVWEGVRG